jgi:hypothetical protein
LTADDGRGASGCTRNCSPGGTPFIRLLF